MINTHSHTPLRTELLITLFEFFKRNDEGSEEENAAPPNDSNRGGDGKPEDERQSSPNTPPEFEQRFRTDEYIASTPPSWRPFIERLAHTQLWSAFLDEVFQVTIYFQTVLIHC